MVRHDLMTATATCCGKAIWCKALDLDGSWTRLDSGRILCSPLGASTDERTDVKSPSLSPPAHTRLNGASHNLHDTPANVALGGRVTSYWCQPPPPPSMPLSPPSIPSHGLDRTSDVSHLLRKHVECNDSVGRTTRQRLRRSLYWRGLPN